MELENMDCMSIEELEEYRKVLLLAEEYTRWKIAAMHNRLHVSVEIALTLEGLCDQI